MICPKCAFHNEPFASECAGCGVIFSKLAHARRRVDDDLEERVTDGRMTATEWKVLGFGLVAAIITILIPFTRAVGSAIVTLFHEFGHAVAGWLLGYPSVPAFDFVYGGGITHYGQFRLSIVIAIGCAFAWLGWTFRQNRATVAIISALFLLWLFLVSSEWNRNLVKAAAGHLSEFILAGILFYKALAGVGWRSPEFERPLGAYIAFFVQIHSMLFARRLMTDPDFLAWYREGKGGALMNDLESIALDLQIRFGVQPGIEGVARWLLMFSVVPIIVALIWYFERARWHRVLRALRTATA